MDENGVEVTNAYKPHLNGAFADFGKSRPITALPGKEFTDENYDAQQRIYWDQALKKEKETFLKLNPSIKKKELLEKYAIVFDKSVQSLYMINKQKRLSIPSGYSLNTLDAQKKIDLDLQRKRITEKKLLKEYNSRLLF